MLRVFPERVVFVIGPEANNHAEPGRRLRIRQTPAIGPRGGMSVRVYRVRAAVGA